jgi:hypothetical protein
MKAGKHGITAHRHADMSRSFSGSPNNDAALRVDTRIDYSRPQLHASLKLKK